MIGSHLLSGRLSLYSSTYKMEGSCLQLALEGERLCKSGDCINGVQFFEAAVKSGNNSVIMPKIIMELEKIIVIGIVIPSSLL